jgi:hypothetical protein
LLFSRDPVQLDAGMNLAVVECGAGRPGATLEALNRLLTFDPDNHRAKAMMGAIRSGKQSCEAK